MSSHREAPEISKDPVADNTDVYAFVSPDQPDTVTLIANFIPLEVPSGGPNFNEFGDDVLYEIHIDNSGDAIPDITYQFNFKVELRNPNTFLYNTGPITAIDSPNWNRRQFYSVTKVDAKGNSTVLGTGLASPPVNVGPRSTPNYSSLANAAIHSLSSGEKVFAGQRQEGFYVDVGSIFDLGALRPFQSLHLIHPPDNAPGVDATKVVNVHTIAIQVPKTHLTVDGSNPTDAASAKSVIGVWASASRYKATVRSNGQKMESGPFVQVSRLANPLFNEVIIPMGKKDLWNSLTPQDESQFAQHVEHPELAALLPVLYPKVFPNLAAYTAPRADLVAILLTGIPAGIVKGFQNFTGKTLADMQRLNMAIPPSKTPSLFGLLGGDPAGFPNGRRVFDDVTTVELRAIAGLTIPLVDPKFKPDAAAALISDFSNDQFANNEVPGADRYIENFPYLGVPHGGYEFLSPK